MLFALALLLTIGCIAFILARGGQGVPRPDGLRGRIRARGWGLLLLRPDAPDAGLVRALAARWLATGRAGISTVHALLLIPVVALSLQLLGPHAWFGREVAGLDVLLFDLAVATAALVLIFRSRAWAAALAAAGLLVLGAYGWLIAVFWPVPGFAYGFSDLHNSPMPAPLWADALEGSLLLALGLWLAPRVMRHHLAEPPDLELAVRAQQLTKRVQTLTRTRHDAVDTAAAELRRIERDLHDGAHLLDRLGAGGQPRVFRSRLSELPALLQVARRALPAGVPVGVLLDGQVPHVPGVAAVFPQHRLLGGGGDEPVPGHANTISDSTDVSGEVTRRFLPALKAGVSTPRS
jgi:hypothetical protein